MMKIVQEYGPAEIMHIVEQLVRLMASCSIITFQGPIGAGKTTLIRAFLHRLGINESIVSPTFTYMVAYRTAEGRPVYHFDLYRIRDSKQFEAFGFNDYLFEPGALILIEWPEVIAPLLKMQHCAIALDYGTVPSTRLIRIMEGGCSV